jgi:asparagine synthase (glutamine-hydrolysing)
MCGIAGVVGVIDRPVAEGVVQKMVCALARRGPDAEGIESWDEAVLGHRRLAIYDLSEAGHQPMVSADRSVGIVFNGSIYNYRELREELIARGYIFASHTDTEVLIHGYREWGLDKLISKLRGMFAMGLWDDRIRKLYLVRDRLGVKPLVFAIHNRVIMFASTIRALRVAGFVSDLDESAVTDFLEFGFITDAHSIYRGAVKVPAASIIEWSDGRLNKREYWALPIAATSPIPSFHEAVEETERLFLRSVEVRLHADVPVGALLSSGIDSGLVCWAAAKLGGDITAYTIGTPGDPWDEAMAASATARIIGIKHRVMEMSERDVPEMAELVSAYAEPFACASALGMLRVSRAVAPSAKVLLTGDGGDDVFLGYPRHRHLWLAGKLARRLPSTAKHSWFACRSAFPRIGPLRRAAALFDYATGGLGAFVGNDDSLSNYKVNGLLGDRLLPLPLDRCKVFWSTNAGHRVLADFLDYERKTRFVGEYMTKVDGATMHYALEARSPFLDHVLWEFASSLPFDLRLHGGRLKAILRELARRRIGGEVARRRKRGFGIPVQRWMIGHWRPQVEAALSESILEKEGWIRSGLALSQLGLAAREGWAPHQLWYLFVLESWIRHERLTA